MKQRTTKPERRGDELRSAADSVGSATSRPHNGSRTQGQVEHKRANGSDGDVAGVMASL